MTEGSILSLRDKICAALKAETERCDALKDDALDEEVAKTHEIRHSLLNLIHTTIQDRDRFAHSKDQCNGCEETEILTLLRMMERQRLESIEHYESSGQLEMAAREAQELQLLQEFLPQPLTADEARHAVNEIVDDLNANSLKDIHRCLGALRARFPNRIEDAQIADYLREKLLGEKGESQIGVPDVD